MLAIMGPSGSGKTTMLNVLSGKLKGKFEGDVYLNNQRLDKRMMKRVSAFVPQEDILPGSMTTYETLMFYANLKLPKDTTHSQKDEMISGILTELGLTKVKNTIIGYVGADAVASALSRGLSGGERKRLSIGCQLISNPSLLFLDEPTTGLDSFAAYSVISTLSKLSLQGRTIIFTIHQPSSEINSLFDKILLLGKGRSVYFGEFAEVLDYFSSIGYTCPGNENPSDFFLNTIHGDTLTYLDKISLKQEDATFKNSEEQALELSQKFEQSKYYKFDTKEAPPPIPLERTKNLPGFFSQVGYVMGRQLKGMTREPSGYRANVMQTIIVAVFFGLIFLQLERTQTGLQNITGSLFFSSVNFIIFGLMVSFFLFPPERKLFLHQNQDGLYSTGAYYTGKMLLEIPSLIPINLFFSIIFYWMVGLNPNAGRFFTFFGVLFVLTNVAFAAGILLICTIPDVPRAMQLFPMIFIPLLLFSGFYLNSDNAPVYFIWVEHISFLKYIFRALMNNEFQGSVFTCTPDQLVNGVCPFTTGDQWLTFWKMDEFPLYGDVLIAIQFCLLFHLLAYVVLRRDTKRSTA